MTDRAALLDYADQLLDGTVTLGLRGPRTAALLARRAFEDWLDEFCASWTPNVGPRPSTASKLVVLEVVRGAAVGERAKRMWYQLVGGLSSPRVRTAAVGVGGAPSGQRGAGVGHLAG